ncbi:hypothetical protein BDV95DRAFT_603404 [Massariosphaeria phaeospora]|uniref:Uncharacterized protein n=1 Tax=Massariosphaeria phaeospora TaxID=100035 RepID=A0A7C8ICE4_9PLEO|nr:hypothetical protein BDV95DRAFT_603404 [Massariosphaeria phaeospora]
MSAGYFPKGPSTPSRHTTVKRVEWGAGHEARPCVEISHITFRFFADPFAPHPPRKIRVKTTMPSVAEYFFLKDFARAHQLDPQVWQDVRHVYEDDIDYAVRWRDQLVVLHQGGFINVDGVVVAETRLAELEDILWFIDGVLAVLDDDYWN